MMTNQVWTLDVDVQCLVLMSRPAGGHGWSDVSSLVTFVLMLTEVCHRMQIYVVYELGSRDEAKPCGDKSSVSHQCPGNRPAGRLGRSEVS